MIGNLFRIPYINCTNQHQPRFRSLYTFDGVEYFDSTFVIYFFCSGFTAFTPCAGTEVDYFGPLESLGKRGYGVIFEREEDRVCKSGYNGGKVGFISDYGGDVVGW